MKFIKAFGELLLGALIGIGAIALVAGLLFLGVVGSVAIGWIAGVFVNWVFGGLVINGINLILGTALAKSSLPAITGALGFFAYIVRGGSKDVAKITSPKKKVKQNAKA